MGGSKGDTRSLDSSSFQYCRLATFCSVAMLERCVGVYAAQIMPHPPTHMVCDFLKR